MTVREALSSLSSYPIPSPVLTSAAEGQGLNLYDELDADARKSREYRLAIADVYKWLSTAAAISQGGVTISLTDADKAGYKNEAMLIQSELAAVKPRFGYKGSKL